MNKGMLILIKYYPSYDGINYTFFKAKEYNSGTRKALLKNKVVLYTVVVMFRHDGVLEKYMQATCLCPY